MKPKWAISIVVLMSLIHYAIMGYEGYDPSYETETLMVISLTFMFAWWVLDDAKAQKYHRPYEFGAFIFFAWPILIPVYLVETRGWKGLLLFPVFIGVYYLPWSVGWLAYYLNVSNQ